MKLTDLTTKDKELKKKNKDRDQSSPVLKHARVNRAQTHKDKKKAKKYNPRKATKHKSRMYESFLILCETKEGKVWTKEEIKEKLKSDDNWLIRGLLAIYDRQTEEEQSSHATQVHNGIGFNAYDAEFLTNSAKFYQSKGFLSDRHLRAVRRAMIKYSAQLSRIANGQA
jgi:hypothetical protein